MKICWKLEYNIVLFIIFGIIIAIMPFSIENTREANIIARWNEKINRVEYMFSVINAHITDEIIYGFNETRTPQEREFYLLALMKPYMRINDCPIKHRYKTRYMNGEKVYKGQIYYFQDLYLTENRTIVGIKDVKTEKSGDPLFIMMFDMNGFLPPNTWGRDIFGLNIFANGVIRPFGYGSDINTLKNDCSKSGTGLGCSYYYKIGGGFDE